MHDPERLGLHACPLLLREPLRRVALRHSIQFTLSAAVFARRQASRIIPPRVCNPPPRWRVMASYDLVCDACGHDFEVFRQGFLKDEDRVCPDCGSTEVRQKFTSFLKNIGGSSSGGGCAPVQRQPLRLRLIPGGAVAPHRITSSPPQATALQAPGGPSGLRAPSSSSPRRSPYRRSPYLRLRRGVHSPQARMRTGRVGATRLAASLRARQRRRGRLCGESCWEWRWGRCSRSWWQRRPAPCRPTRS